MRTAAGRLAWLAFLSAVVGCASSQRSADMSIGETLDVEKPDFAVEEPSRRTSEPPPEDIIVQHAAPISGYRNQDEQGFEEESLMTHLAAADVICFGERHDVPADHYAQLEMVHAFLDRRQIRGFELGLGLEMVRSQYQPVLDDFIAGEISEDELEQDTRWAQQWGFPIQFYRPQMREILVQGGELLALGVPRDITRKVAKKGLSGLNENDRLMLPDLDLDVKRHRRLFGKMMQGHPGMKSEGALENYYLAQVIWDEAMAAKAAAWATRKLPGRKLLIFAGAAHCHPSAIPERISKRGPISAVSVLPVASDELRDASRQGEPPAPRQGDSPGNTGAAPPEAGNAADNIRKNELDSREMMINDYHYLLILED